MGLEARVAPGEVGKRAPLTPGHRASRRTRTFRAMVREFVVRAAETKLQILNHRARDDDAASQQC